MKTSDVLNKEQMAKLEEIKKNYPIFRNFNSGKYGWDRVNDCANLSSATFDTEHAAKLDRHNTLKHSV